MAILCLITDSHLVDMSTMSGCGGRGVIIEKNKFLLKSFLGNFKWFEHMLFIFLPLELQRAL